MKAIRKVLVTGACAALLVGASVLTTMAYLTDQGTVTNTFTVGNVHITLNEAKTGSDGIPESDDNGTDLTPNEGKTEFTTEQLLNDAKRVTENDYHLLPGHVYYKDPTVHITKGSEDCYVWMSMEITNSSAWDEVCDKYEVDTDGNVTARATPGGTVSYGSHALGITDILKEYNSIIWQCLTNIKKETANTRTYWFVYQYNPDGGATDANILTKDGFASSNYSLTPLFQRIEIPGAFTNEDMGILNGVNITTDSDAGGEKIPNTTDNAFTIIVKAYAIQADGMGNAADAWNKYKGDDSNLPDLYKAGELN